MGKGGEKGTLVGACLDDFFVAQVLVPDNELSSELGTQQKPIFILWMQNSVDLPRVEGVDYNSINDDGHSHVGEWPSRFVAENRSDSTGAHRRPQDP